MSGAAEQGAGRVRVFLTGSFRVETSDGLDLTPKSAKNCGLLALLASHTQSRRSRSWLQSRLWSDRGREQASASLRQALSQLKRGLGDHGALLIISRAFVALNRDLIDVVRDPAAEFLEGLDLRDTAFEDWVRSERRLQNTSAIDAQAEAAPSLDLPHLLRSDLIRNVFVQAVTLVPGPERLFEDLFIDCFERWVSEALICQVHRRVPDSSSGNPIVVGVQAYPAGGRGFGLRISMEEAKTKRALWSGRKVIEAHGAPPVDHVEFLSLVHEATEALADSLVVRLQRNMGGADAAILGRMSLHKIFSMNVDEVEHADHLLQRAFDLDPRAIFLSWRGQLRIIQQMERHSGNSAERREEIDRLTREAIRLEPTNSMVLSVAANAQLLIEDDVHAGLELARRAVSQNPANPFAWDAMSIGLAMSGKQQEAHVHQLRAFAISQKSPIRHFWDMGACLTSVATGKFDQARKLAHNASVMVPDFRPPLRYMAALDAVAGDTKAALQSVEKLRKLEPDFSLKKMVQDEDYPVAGLRRAGILSKDKLNDLT